jgi:hypothetical protein
MACVDFLLLVVIPVVSLYMMIERFRYSQKKNERFRRSQEKIRLVLVQCEGFLVLENSSFRVRHNFQNRILSRNELPAPGCTRRLDEAETPSL